MYADETLQQMQQQPIEKKAGGIAFFFFGFHGIDVWLAWTKRVFNPFKMVSKSKRLY